VLNIDELEEPGAAGYSLALSEAERLRYRTMAEAAARDECEPWIAAGIVEGARVADIGCGPGCVLRVLAEHVGRHGNAIGVDADQSAISYALEEVASFPQAAAQVGTASESGLEPASFDVVMCRHVLAHNGRQESAIEAHLASLTRPGGCVYLVDTDLTIVRITGDDPELQDLRSRYNAFQQARGNDVSVGLRLGDLLADAGLTVERYALSNPSLVKLVVGYRPPAWAARADLVAHGFATDADVGRWEEGFARLDALESRPWVFGPIFVAIGRRP
jgi:SAM-dependent methyltransferase